MTASNFAHLEPEFPAVHAAATSAERLALSEPVAAAILAGKAVELALGWAFAHDAGLTPPAQTGAGRMINDPDLQAIMGQKVHAKARFINMIRNRSAHEGATLKSEGARQVVEELHHVLHWFGRTYARRQKPPDAQRGGPWLRRLCPVGRRRPAACRGRGQAAPPFPVRWPAAGQALCRRAGADARSPPGDLLHQRL